MADLADTVPGYREALARERELREIAFVGAVAPIAGVEVVPLTIRRLNMLMAAGNAFAIGGPISSAHAVQFLWVVSPTFKPGDMKARDVFLRSVANLPAASVYDGIRQYLDDTFFDLESSASSRGTPPPIASWVAVVVDRIASEYGWSRDEILDTPIVELSQYIRVIDRRHGATVLNPTSNGVLMKWLAEQNKRN